MSYFEHLADLLLDAIPNGSEDLPKSTRITINDFLDGDVYELEYMGYSGLMANPRNGHTGGHKAKLGYFDFKVHTGNRYNGNLVTHYQLFNDLLNTSNLNNCIKVYKGLNPLEITHDISEQKALLTLSLLMFEQEVNWGKFDFQKNSQFPPDLSNPTKARPRDMIMGMLLQAFDLGINEVDTWKVNQYGYRTTAYFGENGYANYERKEYFEERLRELEGGCALMTGKYFEKFNNKVSNKRNNPHFQE